MSVVALFDVAFPDSNIAPMILKLVCDLGEVFLVEFQFPDGRIHLGDGRLPWDSGRVNKQYSGQKSKISCRWS